MLLYLHHTYTQSKQLKISTIMEIQIYDNDNNIECS